MCGLCLQVFVILGVQELLHILSGIASHKFFVVFCVCMELQQSDTPRTLFLSYLTVFSWITPVGTAIGVVISETGASSGNDVAIACLQVVSSVIGEIGWFTKVYINQGHSRRHSPVCGHV